MVTRLPLDIMVFWPKTHASIPANFTRVTDFDGKYLSGSPDNVSSGTNGGNVNHIHTPDTHDHPFNPISHSHLMTITGSSTGNQLVKSGGTQVLSKDHSHENAITNVGLPVLSFDNSNVLSNVAKPKTVGLILITPNDSDQDIPVDGLILSDNPNFLIDNPDYKVSDGTNGTVDADLRFAQIPTTGADGGVLDGDDTHIHGTATHGHISTDSHANTNFGSAIQIAALADTSGFGKSSTRPDIHHRTNPLFAAFPQTSQNVVGMNAKNNDPLFHTLLAAQNRGASPQTPDEFIAPFKGTLADISNLNDIGYSLCNGTRGTPDLREKQIKMTKVTGNIGNISGNNIHTHIGDLHGHDVPDHDHPFTFAFAGFSQQVQAADGNDTTISALNHTHSSASLGFTATPIDDVSTTMSTDDIRLSYREVLWVKRSPFNTTNIKGAIIKGAKVAA